MWDLGTGSAKPGSRKLHGLGGEGVCRWDIPFSVHGDLALPSPSPWNPCSLTFKPCEQAQSVCISAPCSLWPHLSFSSGTTPSWDFQPPDSPVIIHFLPPSYMSFLWPPSIFAVAKTILCPHLSHFTPEVHDFWGWGGWSQIPSILRWSLFPEKKPVYIIRTYDLFACTIIKGFVGPPSAMNSRLRSLVYTLSQSFHPLSQYYVFFVTLKKLKYSKEGGMSKQSTEDF